MYFLIGSFAGFLVGFLLAALFRNSKTEHITCRNCKLKDTSQCVLSHYIVIDFENNRKWITEAPENFYCKNAQEK